MRWLQRLPHVALPSWMADRISCHTGTTPWQLCGMDGLVPKPLTAAQLQTALQRVLDHSAVPSAATAAPASAAAPADMPAAGRDAAGLSGCQIATIPAAAEAAPETVATLPSDAPQVSGRGSGRGAKETKPAFSSAIATTKREMKRRGSPLRRTSSSVSAGSFVTLHGEACTASSPGL